MRKYKKSFKTKNKKTFFKILKKVFLNKFFWLSFLGLAVIGGLVYLFFLSSVFKIKEFQISGCEKINPEQIRDFFSTQKGANMFLTNFEDALATLSKDYPIIASADLKRKLPNLVILKIEERKPVVCKKILNTLSGKEEIFLIDKEGIAFERVFEIKSDIIKIRDYGQDDRVELGEELMKKNDIENILKIENKLKSINLLIDEIEIVSLKRLNVKTAQGFKVYFNSGKNLTSQLEKLEIILKEKIPLNLRKNVDYIDLRFEKIFISPENYGL